MSSLTNEASKNYMIALGKVNVLLKGGNEIIPKDHLSQMKANLYFGGVKYMVIAGLKLSKHHQNLSEENIKEDHIGTAIGYTSIINMAMQKVASN